jgi:hypothetical protein
VRGFEPKASPVWGLSQWSSRFALDGPQAGSAGGCLIWSNAAKSITLGRPDTPDADLSLAVNTGVEYGAKARRQGEPWVHLLVEQEFAAPADLERLDAARFHLEARLLRSRNLHRDDYSPAVHAAQFQVFFTVQNRNRQSPGHGDLLARGFSSEQSEGRRKLPEVVEATLEAIQGFEEKHPTAATVYYLDLLAHRDVSNEIARKLDIRHESPQAIVLKDGKPVAVGGSQARGVVAAAARCSGRHPLFQIICLVAPLVPADTLVFASLANLSQPFSESYALFRQRVVENTALADWWGKADGPRVAEVLAGVQEQ